MMKKLRLAAMRAIGLCMLAAIPSVVGAELPQFVPSGSYAIGHDGEGGIVWLANPLVGNGVDWDPVKLQSEYSDKACAWRLNDEGGGYVSVRNTRGGQNDGDYIMKDSKIRVAATVNFVDYKNNQTFRFFGTEGACIVMSNAENNRYWTSSQDKLTLSYAVSAPESATVFTLVPLYLHDEIAGGISQAQGALADVALNYDAALREILVTNVADAVSLIASPGYSEADAEAVLAALTDAYDKFVASGRAPSANDLSALSKQERNSLEALSLDGDVTGEDFLIIRSDMINLRELHLEESTLTELPDHALSGMSRLQKVILPQGLRTIGRAAFLSCESLAEVVLPESLQAVGALAFARSGLTKIALGARVESIGRSAFDGCMSLESIVVEEGNPVYSAPDNILLGAGGTEILKCPPLRNGLACIPDGVKSIADYSFQGCRLLTGPIEFPAGLERIGDFAFAGCVGLSGELSLPGGLAEIGRYAFLGDAGLTGAVAIPESVKSVGEGAFAHLPMLSEVSLPTAIPALPRSLFECDANIAEIRSLSKTPPVVENFALRGVDRFYTYVNVPSDAVESWRNADIWCEFDNFEALFEGYDRFDESGKYYIMCEAGQGGYLSYDSRGAGVPAYFEPEKDEATLWTLDFFPVTSLSLPYTGGPGSDIRFIFGSTYRHINMEGLCFSDPIAGYERRDNRTFAFWLAPDQDKPDCPLVAIQGNGYIWGADSYGSDVLAVTPFSAAYPRPGDFVFRLIPKGYVEDSGLTEVCPDFEAEPEFFNLKGERVNPSACGHGIYIMRVSGRVMKIKL